MPIFGYMLFLGTQMNKTLTRLSKEYGPIYQLQVGSLRMLIVNGHQHVREGLAGPKSADFAAR